MGFFSDILTGGYNLHKKVVPKEIRKWEPRELQPGGLNLSLGIDVDGSLARAQKAKLDQQEAEMRAKYQGLFDQGAALPQSQAPNIAPMGPAVPPSGAYGLLAQQQATTPTPMTPPVNGPYGLLAQQAAQQPPELPQRPWMGTR